MSANWFVGLPIEGSWMAERVPSPPPEVRLFHQDDLHLTVAFLGACGEERARLAWDALAWPTGAIDASLGEVVPMGSPRHYSALSALLVRGRIPVEDAIGASRGAICEAAGVEVDSRPPKAHLTIARPTRRAGDSARAEALRWAAGIRLEDIEVRVDRVALYTWSEDRAERLFRAIETRSLAP